MSKIFLVDDDTDLTELMQSRLTKEGHQVHTVNTGEGAFEAAKKFKPDIAVLDVMLPEVTGYQICRRIRKDPELYPIGVLVLTALGEEPEMIHGLEQGADDYLAKPFKMEVFNEKLGALESLLSTVKQRHPITQLPGTDAIKREINFRLARGSAVGACYITVTGFKPYCAVYGREGQKRVLSFMGNLLTRLARDMGIYECTFAHMGGEHFVGLLNLDDYERYCNALMRIFDEKILEIYNQEDRQRGYILAKDKRGREGKYALMALSIGVAHTQHRAHKNAKKLFEVLAQAREVAQPDGKSVMFVDRRKSER